MLSYNSNLRIGFLAAGFLSLTIGLVSWTSNRNLAESKDWESHTFAVLSRIENFSSIIKDSELHFINFLSTREKIYAQEYESSSKGALWNLEDLESLTKDNPDQQTVLQNLESNLQQRDELIRKTMQNRFDGQKAKSIVSSIEENIRSLTEALKQRENDLLIQRAADSRTKIAISEWVVSISILFNVLLLVVWYRFLTDAWKRRAITEKELFQKNELLELILESMADGIFVMDEKGAPILRNDKAEVLLKNSPELLAQLNALADNKGKFKIHNGSHEDKIILANAQNVRGLDGQNLGKVFLLSDITSEENIAKELGENVQKLEYANRELEAFSYSVSHDLRAPIRGVDGFARILLEDHSSSLDKEGLRILNVIAENSKFMGQLIDDLLAFYRVSKVEPRREKIDMKHMVHDVIEIVTQEYPKDDVVTEVGELPLMIGDPSMIKQVWLNLISNSFKYSSKISKPKIEVGVIDGESEKTFFVKDNGAGFNEKYSHKLFKVFQRLHSNEEFYGTGIGLAIVDRIVGRHGGRVWGTGKIGEGATFYFTLPKKDLRDESKR